MSERILIVDDDPWILRMVSAILEKKGYAIVTATDGEEGLLRADQCRPDLIISDVMMPKMDGWQMVKTLRSRSELALIPVIFLTALSGEEDRIKGFRMGADDYLPKPFRFEELDSRVANAILKGKAARQAAYAVTSAQAPASPPPVPGAAKKPAQPKPAGIHGQLEQLGLSSLLVILEMERKSGVLRVEKVGATGRIFAKDGRVLSARLDGEAVPPEAKKGAHAVYHMLTWTSGRFDFSALEVDMEDEVQASTTNLLMEGARLIDEANRF